MKSWLLGAGVVSLLMASDAVAPLGKYTPAERRHWAFVPRSQPEIPKFTAARDRAWVRNPVDAFILARLQKEGLQPSAEADRVTLIRRLYFDMTGLPPAPRDVERFVADRSPDAYPRLVEELLNSPHYGERWAQDWLDLVRFAESDGFEYDRPRNDAWRYRDYVIRAFQNDKPYDRFIAEQLAGDEIAPKEDECLVAAGFNRMGPLRLNAGNQDVAENRNEVLTEMTNVVGAAFLGVTLGCARCHDHKFDPIRQSDYYRMQAYFAAAQSLDVPRSTPEVQAAWKTEVSRMNSEIRRLRVAMKTASPDEQGVMIKKIEALQEDMPLPPSSLHSMSDDLAHKTTIHLLARGDYRSEGDTVGMRPLGVLLPDAAPETPADTAHPRATLAQWVTDPENPLTARVMVNRIWQHHFSRGIVATPNDFGRMGARPSHPELLDCLANEFVAHGFSVKHVQRLILLSSAYRQASDTENAAAQEKDPDNRLLWKFNRRRLEAEEIRDAMLSISGSLNEKQGGPSVIVPVDRSLLTLLHKPEQWAVTKDPSEHFRRSIYLMAKRNLRLPFMDVMDAPDTLVSCPRRESSTDAPQALELLNGDLANQQAGLFAARLEKEAGPDSRRQVDLAFRLATGRAPSVKQSELAMSFLKTQSRSEFALAMWNINGFLYVN